MQAVRLAKSAHSSILASRAFFEDEELKIAHEYVKSYLDMSAKGPNPSWDSLEENITVFVRDKVDALDSVPAEQKAEVGRKIIDALCDEALESNVLHHCWFGRADHMACFHYQEHIRGLNRPFYQGYRREPWYSFDKGCWDNKISSYQYRDPGEEFAETYASYHAAPACGKKKGEMTPKPLLQWFLKEGLDKADPSRIKNNPGAIKADDHAGDHK